MRDLISVVVPIYNSERYLSECIESIVRQTYPNLELLLINDGSTDSSDLICQKFLKVDRRIKYIKIKNSGISNARNLGLLNANGNYVAFVDADDILAKNYFEILINNMSGYDLIQCRYTNKFDSLKKQTDYFLTFNQVESIDSILDTSINLSINGYVWGKLFDLRNIKRMKIYFDVNLDVCEDLEFVVKYLLFTNNVKSLDYYGYYYRINPTSITNDINKKKKETRLIAYKKIIGELEENKFDEVTINRFNNILNLNQIYDVLDYYKFAFNNKTFDKNAVRSILDFSDCKSDFKILIIIKLIYIFPKILFRVWKVIHYIKLQKAGKK